MKLRALIIDDEPLARQRLAKLVRGEDRLELIGQCADGRSAVVAIQKEKPDLVFLDVQMPEMDGFGVLAALEGTPMPLVIFVTAHDQFALKAFEVQAVDYLLKPFDRERFQTALRRALERWDRRDPREVEQRLAALLADWQPAARYPDRLAVKSGGRLLLIKTADIDWIESADNYVKLHLGGESHLLRETLTALEGRLDPRKFIRISRSVIVNAERVRELQPMFHGEYRVILRNGERLSLSRNYREKLDQLLGHSAE